MSVLKLVFTQSFFLKGRHVPSTTLLVRCSCNKLSCLFLLVFYSFNILSVDSEFMTIPSTKVACVTTQIPSSSHFVICLSRLTVTPNFQLINHCHTSLLDTNSPLPNIFVVTQTPINIYFPVLQGVLLF